MLPQFVLQSVQPMSKVFYQDISPRSTQQIPGGDTVSWILHMKILNDIGTA